MFSDLICALVLFGFFGFLIYAILTKPQKKSDVRGDAFSGSGEALREARVSATKPSPVGLYCEICEAPSRTVSREEYLKLEDPVYCYSCLSVIEAYKARTMRS